MKFRSIHISIITIKQELHNKRKSCSSSVFQHQFHILPHDPISITYSNITTHHGSHVIIVQQ